MKISIAYYIQPVIWSITFIAPKTHNHRQTDRLKTHTEKLKTHTQKLNTQSFTWQVTHRSVVTAVEGLRVGGTKQRAHLIIDRSTFGVG